MIKPIFIIVLCIFASIHSESQRATDPPVDVIQRTAADDPILPPKHWNLFDSKSCSICHGAIVPPIPPIPPTNGLGLGRSELGNALTDTHQSLDDYLSTTKMDKWEKSSDFYMR